MKNSKTELPGLLFFKKWAGKKYSVFKSLKREIVISSLCVTYLLTVPAITLATQKDTTGVKMSFEMDEIEISAQRAPVTVSDVARVVTIITSRQIEAAPVRSISDLLEFVAGADIRQRGSDEVQADVSIRGGTFDQTLILLNGINITDPQTGHHNLNIPVNLNQIERIEVLEGPAARIYGPNAFSGAINIITRKPEMSSIVLSASGGSFGYINPAFSGGIIHGKASHSLSLNYKKSDGYINNTDFRIRNVFYTLQSEGNKYKLSVQAGFTGKAFGANSFYTPKYPNQFEETSALFTSARLETKNTWHITPSVYYRRHTDRFQLFRENPPSWYAGHNYHLTNVYGLNLNGWKSWKLRKSAFGAEYRSENILSNILGEPLSEKKKVTSEENSWYTKSKSRDYWSLFAEHTIRVNRMYISAGTLASIIGNSGKTVRFFPGIDVSYSISPSLKITSSLSGSLRLPTFTDLYYAGPTNVGNPSLKPEKSEMLEAGLKFNSRVFNIRGVGFIRNGKNIIDWTKTQFSEKWIPQNLTSLKSNGIELSGEYNSKNPISLFFPEQIKFSLLYQKIQKSEKDFISYYVLDNLKYKLNISTVKTIFKRIALNATATFQDREGTYTSFAKGVNGVELPYPPFWIFDSKLSYKSKSISAYISLNNAFNKQYFDFGNILQPGRSLGAGVIYTIPFL